MYTLLILHSQGVYYCSFHGLVGFGLKKYLKILTSHYGMCKGGDTSIINKCTYMYILRL
jgi:hypothetical protein